MEDQLMHYNFERQVKTLPCTLLSKNVKKLSHLFHKYHVPNLTFDLKVPTLHDHK